MAVTVSEIRLEPMDITWGATDLGAVSDVALNIEVSRSEIKADQHGDQLLSEVMTGFNVSVSMTIQEMSSGNWSKIVGGATGDNYIPDGGTQVTGWGDFKAFHSLESYAAELKMKPVGASDDARNITFWKAYPIPSSVSFSGTDPSTMSVEFRCVRDTSKNSKINIGAFGDGTQTLT